MKYRNFRLNLRYVLISIKMYSILFFVLKLLSYIPFRVLYFLSDCLYYPLYYIVRYRRGVVRKNLVESFPDKSEQEIIKIEKAFYHFFADQVLETAKMTTISEEEISKRMKFVNVQQVTDVMRGGKSIALYMGHYGNWEWVSSIPLWLDKEIKVVQIYHTLANQNMDKLMLRNRERMGGISVEMRKTARYITGMALSRQTGIVGFISDHSPRRKDATYFIPFLNHNTPVVTGSEKVIKHCGYEAWFLNVRRVKRGYYEAEFVRIEENTKLVPDFEITDKYFKLLEEMITKCPELYLWTHNRFKYATKL